jgi:hypothetical protein
MGAKRYAALVSDRASFKKSCVCIVFIGKWARILSMIDPMSRKTR